MQHEEPGIQTADAPRPPAPHPRTAPSRPSDLRGRTPATPKPPPTKIQAWLRSPKFWAASVAAILWVSWLLSGDPAYRERESIETWIAATPGAASNADYIAELLDQHHAAAYLESQFEEYGTMKFNRERYRFQLFSAMWDQADAERQPVVAEALRRAYSRYQPR